MKNQITLYFDGSLSPQKNVSLRTLSYTLPHIQRAIDKTVYFNSNGKLTKYTSLPHELYPQADLYISNLEYGSLKIPFLSDLISGVPQLFNEFMRQPYELSANEVKGHRGILRDDLENRKIHANLDNLRELTQEDILQQEGERKRAYAQAAVLKDMATALSLVRSTDDAILGLNIDSATGFKNFHFDQRRAANFSRIATTKRLSDAVIYKGRITGLEKQHGNTQFKYSAKFLSSVTGKECKLLIADYDDAIMVNTHNLTDNEVVFWGSPIALHEAFDPVRGDIVFIDFIN